jgi:hypothetical protein
MEQAKMEELAAAEKELQAATLQRAQQALQVQHESKAELANIEVNTRNLGESIRQLLSLKG